MFDDPVEDLVLPLKPFVFLLDISHLCLQGAHIIAVVSPEPLILVVELHDLSFPLRALKFLLFDSPRMFLGVIFDVLEGNVRLRALHHQLSGC